eukprot:scaffold3068_cov269-Pinguiococcus_pyrenoidosus.AAC.11
MTVCSLGILDGVERELQAIHEIQHRSLRRVECERDELFVLRTDVVVATPLNRIHARVQMRGVVGMVSVGEKLFLLRFIDDALLDLIDPDGGAVCLSARKNVGVVAEEALAFHGDVLHPPVVVHERLHRVTIGGAILFIQRLEASPLYLPPLQIEDIRAEIGMPVLEQVLLAQRVAVLKVLGAAVSLDLRVKNMSGPGVEIIRDDVIVQVEVIEELGLVGVVAVRGQEPLRILRALRHDGVRDLEGAAPVRRQVRVLNHPEALVVQLTQEAVQADHLLRVRLHDEGRPRLVVQIDQGPEHLLQAVDGIRQLPNVAADEDADAALRSGLRLRPHGMLEEIRHALVGLVVGKTIQDCHSGASTHRRQDLSEVKLLEVGLDVVREDRGIRGQREQEPVTLGPGVCQLLFGAPRASHHHGSSKKHGLERVQREGLIHRGAEVEVRRRYVVQGVVREGDELHRVRQVLRLDVFHEIIDVAHVSLAPRIGRGTDQDKDIAALAEDLATHKLQGLHQHVLLLPLANGAHHGEHELVLGPNRRAQGRDGLGVAEDRGPLLGRGLRNVASERVEVSHVCHGPEGTRRVGHEHDAVDGRREAPQAAGVGDLRKVLAEPVPSWRLPLLRDLPLMQHPSDPGALRAKIRPSVEVVCPHDRVKDEKIGHGLQREVRADDVVQAVAPFRKRVPEVSG